jgi:hypothetical protein
MVQKKTTFESNLVGRNCTVDPCYLSSGAAMAGSVGDPVACEIVSVMPYEDGCGLRAGVLVVGSSKYCGTVKDVPVSVLQDIRSRV